jgi:transcriptional regulator
MPVLRGTLDVLVLKAIASRPMHGYEVTEWIEERGGGSLAVFDSALYQALYRLEERRLIKAAWAVTEHNRRARYYEITSDGRAHLKAELAAWARYATTVSTILGTPLGA